MNLMKTNTLHFTVTLTRTQDRGYEIWVRQERDIEYTGPALRQTPFLSTALELYYETVQQVLTLEKAIYMRDPGESVMLLEQQIDREYQERLEYAQLQADLANRITVNP